MDNPQTAIIDIPPMAQLARKMANIMGQLKRLKQGGQNAQGWTFTSIDDITDAIRALMSEHGIALFSKMLKATQVKEGKTTLATVDMEFELVCADSGASKVMSWTGSAEDYSDKAINKAAVYAEKFWLKSTFLVSTGKDPDAKSPRLDNRPVERQQPQRPTDAAKHAANGRHVDMQTGEVLSNKPLQPDTPRMAGCLATDAQCQREFSALRKELGIIDDRRYLDYLQIERYSDYTGVDGTFENLCMAVRNLHARFKQEDAQMEADAVKQASAQISTEQAKETLGTPKGSSTRPTPDTSNGGTATTGATSASDSNDDIPPDPINPHFKKRPNGAAETMLDGMPAIGD